MSSMSSSRNPSRFQGPEMAPRPSVRQGRYMHSRPVPPHHRTIAQLESDIQNLHGVWQELVARSSEIEVEIRSVKDRLREREARRGKLKEITEELDIAQRFLSTADGLSQTEAIRAMESLNEEIFQLTSIVADQLPDKQRKLPDVNVQKPILERSPLLKTMDSYSNVLIPLSLNDPLAIQIGWQAIFVQFCFATIDAWEIEDLFCGMGELDSALRAMYEGIQSENNHAVSQRWRSMVYGVTDDVSSTARRQILDRIVINLTDLPEFCGYTFTDEIFNKIFTLFRERIDPLYDKCLQVRKMIGKDITSTDIGPYFFPSGTLYDATLPAELEHEVEEEGSPKDRKGSIICSVSLGLYCMRESGDQEPILRPKVILENTFKEIIG